ncbi:hypothetical protein F3Y22_tig00109937pilonHSYRG00042 [Hibiscus syriacus]|uniref:RRM domain-containing protein n=1 Tax=Hibiscus syriacus TaxID=106335 RepID=A0A6A3BXB1_HIBSY|nr:hypothetical protein F3Y22_tig00109937pilonHSYRG00042 [Hibiscus syriacus]
MEETGPLRFPRNLDPSAQEFWPASKVVCLPQFLIFTPTQLYYPFAAASPTVPLCNGGVPPLLAMVPVHAPVPAPAPYVAPHPSLPPPTVAATRALVLTLVPCDVSETEVRKELEVFGEVRGVQMERVRETVTVHFYDLRHAEKALKEIRDQHMQLQTRVRDQYVASAAGCDSNARGLVAGRPVSAHFVIPASNAVPDGINQGTIVAFNLDPSVSISKLKDIFQAYGMFPPSEGTKRNAIEETPKVVEYYDIRDAAKALREMNGKEINVMNSSEGNPNEMEEGVEEKVGSGGGAVSGQAMEGRQAKKFDPPFLISEDAMVESDCKDFRTTVMIKNIPNKYSQKLLLNMLDNHCIHCNEQIAADGGDQPLSSHDFVYLPVDFNNKCNVGYGFVNMTSPQATWRLYKAFHHQHWEVFNSRKICEVTYARVQGLEALKEHFRNSKFPCEMDHYLPVVFSPPRDGKQLTEPLAIVGQKQLQSLVSGPSSAQANGEGDDDDNGDHQIYSKAPSKHSSRRLKERGERKNERIVIVTCEPEESNVKLCKVICL